MLRHQLLETLTSVKAFVASRTSSVAMYRDVCFDQNLISAYNGECGLVTRLPLGISGLVSAERLVKLIDKLPDDQDIQITATDATLTVRCGTSKTTLQIAPSTNFPDLVPKSYGEACSADNLTAAMQTCLSLMEDRASNQFAGVAIAGHYAYATDGRRTTRVRLTSPCAGELLLIPSRSSKLLVRTGQPRQLIVAGGMVGALYDGKMWASTLLGTPFPQYEIDQLLDGSVTGNRIVMEFPAGLSDAVSRSEIFCSDISNGVELVCDGDYLRLRVADRGVGSMEESFEWRFPHAFCIRVNPTHFQAALAFSRSVDLTLLSRQQARHLRFIGEEADHVMALME